MRLKYENCRSILSEEISDNARIKFGTASRIQHRQHPLGNWYSLDYYA